MNKLLLSSMSVLSMLALVTGESWGMEQNPIIQDDYQTNISEKIVIQIPSDVFSIGNTNLQEVELSKSSPSYNWFKTQGVTSLEGIKIICREVKKYTPIGIIGSLTRALPKTKICAWLDPNWSELSPIFDRVEVILPTSLPSHKSFESRRKDKKLQGNCSSSVSVRWANQNGIETQGDLLAATSAAISLSGRYICINRYIKRNKQLLFKFLDDNWEVLQPFMGQALQQVQQPVLQNQQQPQQTQNTSTQSAAVHNSDDNFFFNPPDDDYGNGEFSFNPPDDDYGNSEFSFNPLDDDPSAWKFEGF